MTRRRRLAKPLEPPAGFMFWHGRLMSVEDVEKLANKIMAGFDNLPPHTRRAINEVPVWPHKAAVEVARRGDAAAADALLRQHSEHHFKKSHRRAKI